MNKPEAYADDEINLGEYIKVLIRRKVTILVVLSVCVIIAGIKIVNKPDIYQATASVMIIPSKIQLIMEPSKISLEVREDGKNGRSSDLDLRSTISIPTHKELLKSNELMLCLVDRLNYANNGDREMFAQRLAGRLDIERQEDTNILKLYVKDSDPDMAKRIANAWVDEYIEFTKRLIAGEIKGTGQFIQELFESAVEDLEKIEGKVSDFKNRNNLDLMEKELNFKKEKMNKEKKELMDLSLVLKTKKETLSQLNKEISQQEQFIIVSKSITDDVLWQQDLKGKDVGRLDKKKLSSQIINPIYQDLKTRIVNGNIEVNSLQSKIAYLNESINNTGEQINRLKKEINQKKTELTKLTRQLKIRQEVYNSLAGRVKEARMIGVSSLDEVKVISSAGLPAAPITPPTKQNLSIAVVLGLILGVFAAFLKEYWEKNVIKDEQITNE